MIQDLRNSQYMRFYVGQTTEARRRIPFHVTQILRSSSESLHYFICSHGGGQRIAKFLKLWEFREIDSVHMEGGALLNILEMAFCRAFQSLPGNVLEEYFDAPPEDGFANVGANIIPPLLQSSKLSEGKRLRFVVPLSTSSDPEIPKWFNTRCSSVAKITMAAAKDLLGPNYLQAFVEATVSIPVALDIKLFAKTDESSGTCITSDMMKDMSSTWTESLGRPVALAVPFGLPSAPIAFILDFGRVVIDDMNLHHIDDSADQTGNQSLELPWGFREQGFTERTAMVWTVSLRQFRINTRDVAELQTPQREKLLSQCHRELLQRCSHRVIFLCGPNARRIVLAGIQLPSKLHKLELKLSSYCCEAYLYLGCSSPKLYLFCPEIPNLTAKGGSARRVDMLIRLVTILTETQGIRVGLFERSGILSHILRQAQDETRGAPKLTTSTMDSGLRAWLYRKGITQESDIRRIELAAGSLTRGLLMLLHILPRRNEETTSAKGYTNMPTQPHSKRTHHRPFEAEKFEEVSQIFSASRKLHDIEIENRKAMVMETIESGTTPSASDTHEGSREAGPTNERPVEGTVTGEELSDAEIPDRTPDRQELYTVHERIQHMEEALPGRAEHATFDANTSWEASGFGDPETNEKLAAAFFDAETDERDEFEARAEFILQNGQFEIHGDRPDIRESTTSRAPRGFSILAGEPSRRWNVGSVVKAEWEAKHKVAGYKVQAPHTEHRGGHVITLCYMQIFFPRFMDFDGNHLTIFPEFTESGRHKRVWATRALDTDPASRLAIRICGKRKNGDDFDMYLERNTNNAVTTANAFADRVLEGLDIAQIKNRPRRFVHKPIERASRNSALAAVDVEQDEPEVSTVEEETL